MYHFREHNREHPGFVQLLTAPGIQSDERVRERERKRKVPLLILPIFLEGELTDGLFPLELKASSAKAGM